MEGGIMNDNELKNHKFTNLIHTISLILSMAGLLGMIGWMIAGYSGVKFTLIVAVLSYIFAPKMPVHLVMKAYGAKPLHPSTIPQLYSITSALSKKANLKKAPVLYYIPSKVLNAFAAGTRDNSAVGITHGLLNKLTPAQMAGIIGHEISHIKNNDMQVMWIANLFNRLTGYGSFIGQILILLSLPMMWVSDMHIPLFPMLLLVFSPTISYLLNLALSRTREFEADLGSAFLTGNPNYLASALTTLEHYRKDNWRKFFMASPVNRSYDVLNTHPHSRERINRLMAFSSCGENLQIGKSGRSHFGYQNASMPKSIFQHMF